MDVDASVYDFICGLNISMEQAAALIEEAVTLQNHLNEAGGGRYVVTLTRRAAPPSEVSGAAA